MAVSDWQPRDHCCEEKCCHLPSSTLAPWQIFFWSRALGRGADTPAERQKICPMVGIAKCLCCSATVKFYKISDDISEHFAASAWLHQAACLRAPINLTTVAATADVLVRHCLKKRMSVSTLAGGDLPPFPNWLNSQIKRSTAKLARGKVVAG